MIISAARPRNIGGRNGDALSFLRSSGYNLHTGRIKVVFVNDNRCHSCFWEIFAIWSTVIIIRDIDYRNCPVNGKLLRSCRTGYIVDFCTRIVRQIRIGNVKGIITVCTVSQCCRINGIISVSGTAGYRPTGNRWNRSICICQSQTHIIRIEISLCHFNCCRSGFLKIGDIGRIRAIVVITNPNCRSSRINLDSTFSCLRNAFVSGTVNRYNFNNHVIAVIERTAYYNISWKTRLQIRICWIFPSMKQCFFLCNNTIRNHSIQNRR